MKTNGRSPAPDNKETAAKHNALLNMQSFPQFPAMQQQFQAQALTLQLQQNQQVTPELSGTSLANLSDAGLSCSSFPNAFSSIGSFPGNIGVSQAHQFQGTAGMQNAAFVVNSTNANGGNGTQNASNLFGVNPEAQDPQLKLSTDNQTGGMVNNMNLHIGNNSNDICATNVNSAPNIQSHDSQQSSLNQIQDMSIPMLWKGTQGQGQRQNSMNKPAQGGSDGNPLCNTNPANAVLSHGNGNEIFADASAKMNMFSMQNNPINQGSGAAGASTSAGSAMQQQTHTGMMNNLQMKMLVQQMCQNQAQGTNPSQSQIQHQMQQLQNMQLLQNQAKAQQMHLQAQNSATANSSHNQTVANAPGPGANPNQVSSSNLNANALVGMKPEKNVGSSQLPGASAKGAMAIQQVNPIMSPEEQLIQQKKLIDQIGKKIAEHRMQMAGAGNNGNITGQSLSRPPTASLLESGKQGSQTPMKDGSAAFPANMNMNMTIAQQNSLFQAQNALLLQQQQQKQQGNGNLNLWNPNNNSFMGQQQQQDLNQQFPPMNSFSNSNDKNQQEMWNFANAQSGNANMNAGNNNNNGSSCIPTSAASSMTPNITMSRDDVKSGSPSSWNWQSNRDMSDRKRVLFAIMKIIENIQDRDKKTFEKISVMAKRLEEFLYRSAKSKEEYTDMNSLRKRLHAIARISGIGKSPHPSSSVLPQNDSGGKSTMSATAHRRISLLKKNNLQFGGTIDAVNVQHRLSSNQCDGQLGSQQNNPRQQLELIQSQSSGKSGAFANLNGIGNNPAAVNNTEIEETLKQNNLKSYHPAIAQLHLNLNKAVSKDNTRQMPPDQIDEEMRKKTIRRQQQRLILLRHASKCSLGDKCESAICPKMVKLWSHMKTCKNNNCTTEHCVSSRHVLNHYRVCKELKRIATCEICSPVMKAIQYHDSMNDSQSNDPLDIQLPPDINENICTIIGDQTSSSPLIGSESRVGDVGTRSTQHTGEKDLNLAELQAEQHKLNQQHLLLQRLQQQQEVQLRQNQLSNVPMDSDQAKKLKKQQDLLQKCQRQFIEDQHLLQKLISRHSQLQGENGKNNGSLSTPKDDKYMMPGINDPVKDEKYVNNLNSFLIPTQDSSSSFHDARKRSSDEFVVPGDELNLDTKRQKIEGITNKEKFDPALQMNQSSGPVLDKDKGIKVYMLPLVEDLVNHNFGWVFTNPVDPVELGLPDYFDIIKEPMDLGLVKERLNTDYYNSMKEVVRDVWLVFSNAILYNGEDSDVGKMAVEMLDCFKNACNKIQNLSTHEIQ